MRYQGRFLTHLFILTVSNGEMKKMTRSGTIRKYSVAVVVLTIGKKQIYFEQFDWLISNREYIRMFDWFVSDRQLF